MRTNPAILLTIAMTAHAALGCCWHHDHVIAGQMEVVSSENPVRSCCDKNEIAETEDTRPSEGPCPSDENCDREQCIFAANVRHANPVPDATYGVVWILEVEPSVAVVDVHCPLRGESSSQPIGKPSLRAHLALSVLTI